jgi:acetolactate synthase I/II/III large subunit
VQVTEAIAEILRREGVEFLSCYPTTPLIDAAAALGIRPVVCRQERVGVGIADGFSRATGGRRPGVFAMQYGPGAENAYAGVATAYSDSSPILVLPQGHPSDRSQVFPHFSSARGFAAVVKSVETLTAGDHVGGVMRRAFAQLRAGRPGPVMVETPGDVGRQEVTSLDYVPPPPVRSAADPADVERAAEALRAARRPVICAGQGVLYAGASAELVQLSELLAAPVLTTLAGKSAFPEDHPLALGSAGRVTTGPVVHFMRRADLVLAVGTSLTRHLVDPVLPAGARIVHATADARDLAKDYSPEVALQGDALLVLRQLLQALEAGRPGASRPEVEAEVRAAREGWLARWLPKLTSDEVPLTPYRVIREFMAATDPARTIVTHDAGSPRDQLSPFYRATAPHGYLGWGKSHALGTGLGLAMGAKLAHPDRLCAHFMGDAAFGMTGLDLETSVRAGIPVLAVVFNNGTMAIEQSTMRVSHERYAARDVGGDYRAVALALGAHAERVERPDEIAPALRRARAALEDGRCALVEFLTGPETAFSHRSAEAAEAPVPA